MQIKIIIYRTPPGTATITTISRYLQETLRDYDSIEENGGPGKWLTDWLTDQSCRISLSLIINDGSSSRRTAKSRNTHKTKIKTDKLPWTLRIRKNSKFDGAWIVWCRRDIQSSYYYIE